MIELLAGETAMLDTCGCPVSTGVHVQQVFPGLQVQMGVRCPL